jgi:hypothetical protein
MASLTRQDAKIASQSGEDGTDGGVIRSPECRAVWPGTN